MSIAAASDLDGQPAGLRIGDLGPGQLASLLQRGRLALQTGPLLSRLQTGLGDVAHYVGRAYRHHPCVIDAEFADVSVTLRRPLNLRRWLRSQVEFLVEGESPFEPLPRDQAPALLEWGLNWTIASSCHQWLTIHAACLERGGRAVILPAPPGSGKSTLCAALALRGWRLLSDELTLLDPVDGRVWGLARPINLKNASIDVIHQAFPDAIIGAPAHDTHKGTVAHLRSTPDSIARVGEKARPAWVVFPRWRAGAEARLSPHSRAEAFLHTASHAFNYSLLGGLGFELNAALMDTSECHDFEYSRLDEAMRVFADLATS